MSNEQQDQGGSPTGGWQPSAPSAGWYQDPWDNHRRRYWDGQQWTGDVSFEPPRNWGGEPQAADATAAYPAAADPGSPRDPYAGDPYAAQAGTQQLQGQPAAGWAQPHQPHQVQPHTPQWPAAAEQHPTQAGWGGGWGQPPQVPGGPWAGGQPMWQQAPHHPQPGNRVHVAIVAVIAAIAVLAGIGIGSQINNSSPTASSSNGGGAGAGTGSGGFSSPFGGGSGTGSGTGSSSGSSSLSTAQKALAAKIDKSVVDINTQLTYQNGAAAGTGMVLTSDGAILTNNHVIDGATSISVTLVSTGKVYKASVVGTDVTEDVAVLQLQGASGLTPISIGNSSDVSRGDTVVAIGNAGGAGGTPSAVTGTVRALDQTITASDSNGANAEVLNGLIQTDAPIQAGDSGGPLVDSKGQVIGMDTAASSSNQVNGTTSVGFAIPMANATTIAAQIRQGKASSKIHIGQTGFLGVSVTSSNGSAGSGLGAGLGQGSTVQGASVSGVIPNSPADKAGISMGDTITGVDGTTITSATALTTALRVHHPGDQVSVTWVDTSGQSHTATVTLTVGPAA